MVSPLKKCRDDSLLWAEHRVGRKISKINRYNISISIINVSVLREKQGRVLMPAKKTVFSATAALDSRERFS